MRKHVPLIFALVLLLGGCAGNGATARSGRSDMIVQEQLQGRGFASAYDAIEALRGNWLRTRGRTTLTGPELEIQVYMDNTHLGAVETLRQIPAVNVAYIQWYNANDATARWGIGHGAGAVYVSTTPGR